MNRVAFLSSSDMLVDHPARRPDFWELDLEYVPLRAACAERGVALELVVWDDPAFDPSQFDAAVVATTWDYAKKLDAFLAVLDRTERSTLLLNPAEVVRWNVDKRYLAELEERGAAVVPTLWCERADAASIELGFEHFGTDELVVKPVVGAAAWRQARVRRGEPLPAPSELPPARAMVQPFLAAAADEGEYSFVFFGGAFSHAVLKVPAAGDYRVQSMYGARERAHVPSDADLALARSVLAHVEADLLHARVDLVRGDDGTLRVMELELVEPYLYPEQGPELGRVFADALVARLRRG
ncbi:MAG: hypothetical protein R3F34_01555 [Planctomycetota bacterium]